MNIVINWLDSVDNASQESIEKKLKFIFETDPSPISPCHKGAVTLLVSCPDPLNEAFTGNAKCCCGNLIGTFNGTTSGSVELIQS